MNQEAVAEAAKKYLEDIVAFFGTNVDVEVDISDDVIQLAIPSTESNSILIGRNAENLRAIQYMVTTMVRNNFDGYPRVNIDIADYKKQRADKIAAEAKGWIEGVRKTGDSYVANLNAADRRVVHQLATEYDDIQTFSEGEGRERRLIIAQKSS